MPRTISPGAVVERIWAIYRAEAGVLLPVAAVLFAIQLVIALVLPIGLALLISVLFAVGVMLGFVLTIIPGLMLITFWCLVVPVEVLEHRGVFGSFSRSRELVRGNGWNVIGTIVIVYVAVLAISLLAAVVTAPLGHVGRDIIQWAVNVAITPVVALSASVLYFELIDAGAG